MKKLVILSATAILITSASNAQTTVASLKKDERSMSKQESVIKHEKKEDRKELKKLKGTEVSYESKQAFISDFGKIPVSKWVRTGYFDEATFNKSGQVMTAYYDGDSKLVGTTTHKPFTYLPAKAQKHINEKYKDYSKADVILFDDNERSATDMVIYGTQFNDADNYFVELTKDNKKIILQVNMNGDVSIFKDIK